MIDDLQERQSSEKESDDNSIFDYENEMLLDDEDKKSQSSMEENDLIRDNVKDDIEGEEI